MDRVSLDVQSWLEILNNYQFTDNWTILIIIMMRMMMIMMMKNVVLFWTFDNIGAV